MSKQVYLMKFIDAVYDKLPAFDERTLIILVENALYELEIKSQDVPAFSFDLIARQWTQRIERIRKNATGEHDDSEEYAICSGINHLRKFRSEEGA